MNLISVTRPNENMNVIVFENESGYVFGFGIVRNQPLLSVWCQHKVGNNILAMPSTLSLEWLQVFLEVSICALKETGIAKMMTPLGDCFDLSREDLIRLQDFIQQHA